MVKEIQRLLAVVYEKTSIKVKAISENGLITVGFDGEEIPTQITFEGNVLVDKENNRTIFKFNSNKTNFIGFIDGASEQSKVYATLIGGYIENMTSKNEVDDYNSQVASVVSGFFGKNRIVALMEKYSVNKSPCFAINYELDKNKLDQVKDFLNEYSTNGDDIAVITSDDLVCSVKFSDSEFDYISVKEYANYTVKALYEELGIRATCYIGGEVKSFENIHASYEQAMDALRITKNLEIKRNVNSYKDYVLIKIIEELPKVRGEEYFNSLLGGSASSILKDEQLLLTASTFLNNDLNISETSRQLFIHRNTLMYRIERILKMTGLDIRNFNDALCIRLIMLLNRVIN